MALPKSEGGLGFWSLVNVMEALCMKSAYNFLTSNSPWATFLRNKYIKYNSIALNEPFSTATSYLRHIWTCIQKMLEIAC